MKFQPPQKKPLSPTQQAKLIARDAKKGYQESPKNSHKTLDNWLTALEQAESDGQTKLKLLDSNGKYSYGCLTFQRATLTEFAFLYGL
ncbi:MAG: hypothetical protein Q8N47_21430 [Bryobacterales bacterium]|nr:hypothetical protein [Bryobacterales bacterium]